MVTSAELRAKIAAKLAASKPLWSEVHEHSRQLAALSSEFYTTSLRELGIPVAAGVIVAVLDIREKPANLDAALAQLKLAGLQNLKAFHDLTKGLIYLCKE
jgi:hypothetical protein